MPAAGWCWPPVPAASPCSPRCCPIAPRRPAVDARLSPDGRFLYVDESRIGKVGAFAVNGGNLTELGTSPFALPAGATPAGIVVS
jgi:hypothetical protein